VIRNLDEFESDLCDFLIARGGGNDVSAEGVVHGKTWSWIGLLFAVLACGCQFSDLVAKDRELTPRLLSTHRVSLILNIFGSIKS
jgi:hypothetical protein